MLSRTGTALGRRVTLVLALVAVLSMLFPAWQPTPQGPSGFPLAGLWEILTTRPAWALGRPQTPTQPHGGSVDQQRPRDPEATRVNGGNGRAPTKTPGTLDEWRMPEQADVPQGVSATATVGFQQASSGRIQDGASENVEAFENADGSRTRRVYPKKVNYRGADGLWHPIDMNLRRNSRGELEVTASDTAIVLAAARTGSWGGGAFSGQTAEADGISGASTASRLVSVTLPTGQSIEYGLSGAAGVEPTSRGSTATYTDILPDTDVTVTALNGGVKETMVLKSRSAATEWVFPLRLNGLTPLLESDGSISLRGADGATKLVIPPGTMHDSSRDGAGDSATSDAVSYELTTTAGAPALRVVADAAWIRNPARVFPVMVDPTLQQDGNASTFVQKRAVTNPDCCTSNNSADLLLSTGYHSSGPWNARAFVKFDHFSSTYLGHKVSSASLHAFVVWAGLCASSALRVHDVGAWTPSAVTNWNNQPTLGAEVGSVTNLASEKICVQNDEQNPDIGDTWTVPLNSTGVAMLNRWTAGDANNGVAIASDLNASNANWKKIASVWTDNSPFIEITYTRNEKPQVETVYPPHGHGSPTLTPELIVRATDMDAWPKPLTYRYQVFDSAGAVVADSGATPITSTTWTVPSGKLEWGKVYVWGVVANDGADVNLPYPLQNFSTLVPQPLITSGLAQNSSGQGFEPNVGNYTTSVTDVNVATVGPPLAIQRSYNSRDPRGDTAFGSGWSALLDAKLTITGSTAIVTYPTGQDVAFGQKADGSYQAPSGGMTNSLRAVEGGGYELTDKSGMVYAFTTDAGSAVWKLTSMRDLFGRKLSLAEFVSGRPGRIVSAAGRALTLTWIQPAGAASWHVGTVSTEPSTAGNPSTSNTWTYGYDRDRLVSVCPPTDATHCTTYTYGTNSLLPTAVLDADPHTYLRLSDAGSSPTAASSAVDSIDSAVGVYASVTSGVGGLPGSTAAAAVFDGSSSRVELGKALPLAAAYQTISLWFNTSGPGVLYGYQSRPVNDLTADRWNPALYVDTDGKLRGEFWNGAVNPLTSAASVNNGAWHHAVLVAAGNTQTLYLDGSAVGSMAGQITPNGVGHAYLGTGKWQAWPRTAGDVGYLNGSIRDFAFYSKPLSAAQIATIHQAGVAASSPLERITRPSGGVQASVQYDAATGVVRQVTDANGGVWRVNDASRSNAGQVYRSTVLSRAPRDYFRLADGGPQYPMNEVNGGTAEYNQVTLGVDGGPLGDEVDVASFNGTGSFVRLPAQDLPKTAPVSMSMWFRMPAGSTAGGVLWSYSSHPVEQADSAWGWIPGLYVGTDGKLRAQLFWTGSIAPMTVQAWVNDGLWHHVALTGSPGDNRQNLFLDGVQVGSLLTPIETDSTKLYTAGYVGAGKWSSWPGAAAGTVGYWPGQLGEFAYFAGELSAGEVAAQFAARTRGTSWLGMYPGAGGGAVGAATRLGQQCSDATAVTGAGDFSGDGKADMVCRGLDSVLYLYRGNGVGGFTGGPMPFGWGFDGATKLMWPGDFSGDGKPDLVYRNSTNSKLVMLRGDGEGSWADFVNVDVGEGWPISVFTVGDFTGDGEPDFFYVKDDGTLWLWRGDGVGGWSGQHQVDAGDWRGRELLGGKGDFSGDGKPDIVFRSPADKHLYLVRGNGTGGLLSATPVKIADGQGDRDAVFVAGDLTGDAKADLLFRSMVDPDRPVPLRGVPVKITDVIDPAGNHVRDTHDLSAGGRQIEASNALGKVTTYGYDTGGFVRTVTDPMRNQIIKEYDDRGNVKAETSCQDMSENKCSTTYYSYYFNAGDPADPRNNKVTEVRDARSTSAADSRYLTTYSYDAKGNLTQVTDPLGRAVRNDFTAGDTVVWDLKGLSGSGRYVRVTGTARPAGSPNGYSLFELEVYGGGSCANLARGKGVTVSTTEAAGLEGARATDGLENTRWGSARGTDPQWIYVDLGATEPIDRVRLLWETAYAKSFVVEVSNNLTTWTSLATESDQQPKFVPAGLTSRTVTAGGAAQQVSYSANGDIVRTVDPAGQATCYTRDNLGRITEQSVANDSFPVRVTKVAYDRQDRVTTVTDPATLNHVTGATHTKTTTNGYDFDGNTTSITFADTTGGDAARTVTMEYNAFGQKRFQSDAKNNRVLLEYDAFGRVTKQTAPDGTITEVAYDGAGNQTTTKLNDQLIETRAYDAANRLETVTDAMGWRTLRKYTDNNLVATTIRQDPSSGAQFVLESNVYDTAGHLVSQATNNGVTVTNINVDAAGRMVSQTVDAGGVSRVASYGYNTDDAVTSQTISGPTGSQTTDAVYDTAGRLLEQKVRMPLGTGGPSGWWQLGETSGTTAADSTAAARSGTLSGGASWTDGGVTFDGTGSISTNGPALDVTNSFTVSVWAKRANASGDFCRYAVSQEASVMVGFGLGTCGNRWEFGRSSSDSVNAGPVFAQSQADFTPDTWTHLVGVFDKTANSWKLYVNGVLQSTATVPTPYGATGPVRIGRGKFNGSPYGRFTGSVDNVQLYQRPLSPSDVSTLHGGGRAGAAVSSSAISTSQTFDQSGNMLTRTDPNGKITRFTYDEAGRAVQAQSDTVSTEENGVVTTAPVIAKVGYDTFGGVVEQRDGRGLVTRVERDANGQPVRQISPAYTAPGSSTPVTMTAQTAYNSMGRVDNVTDPLGRQTFYTYDQFGNVRTVKTPDLGVTTYTYHPDGAPASVTDASGARRETTHDYLGRTLTQTQLLRRTGQPTDVLTSTYVYHAQSGWLQKVISPNAARGQTLLEYNNVGEVVRSNDPAGNVTLYGYDFAGRNTLTTLPDGSQRKSILDAAGRTVAQQELSPAGVVLRSSSVTYDSNGNVLTAKDGRGTVSTFAYDALNRLTQSTQPISAVDSIVTSFGYNANGQQTRYTDGRGANWRTTFNTWGLPESEIDPDNATFTTVYDTGGRVDRRLMPGGVSQTFAYDVMDNVERVVGTGAEVATADRVFDYDAVGRMTSLSGPGGTNTLSYDDRGLLTSVAGPSGNSSYTYTSDGLLASRTDAAGVTGYIYDSSGRLRTASNSTAGLASTYDYNNLSQVSQITYGTNQNRRVFGYDNLHRLQTDELKTVGGASIAKITYGWDLNDNETSKTTAGFAGASANTYTYDWANRLSSWNGTVYAYDKSGNRTQAGARSFIYTPGNRLQSSSEGTTYQYTARGTLRSTTVGTVILETFSDAFDQVIEQESSPTASSQYTYDGLGRMLQAGFAYTGLGNDLAKDTTTTYVRDPGGGLLGSKTGANATYSWTDLHTDVVGQFTATATALNGSTTYEPFGKVNATNGMQGSLGYQSEWTDSETKRVNMHARWYNPDTGQFDSRDTINVPNRYNYADNNPLTKSDPSGHLVKNDDPYCVGVPGAKNRFCETDWNTAAHGNYRRSVRAKEREAAERARLTALRKGLPDCMKREKKVRGRPIEEISGCDGAIKKCGQPTGSRFAQYEDSQAKTLKNCTTVEVRPDGSCSINGFDFSKDASPCHDPYLVAKNIDNYAGKLGGYMPDGQPGNKHHLTAIVIGQAVVGAEAQRTNEKTAECQADWWCRNATIIGNVVDVLVSVVVFAGCTAATGGAGVILCGVAAASIGGFTGGIAEGKAQGLAWDDKNLYYGAAGRALTNGVMALAGGGVLSALARPLASVGGRLMATNLGRSLSGTSARMAETRVGQVLTSNVGKCATSVGTDLGLGLATAGRSFTPSTRVLMANGTTTAIAVIEVGDKVTATNPDDGQTSAQEVTAVHVNFDRDLVDVTVSQEPSAGEAASGEGKGDRSTRGPTATIHTTANHPFWDATTKRWTNAVDLRPNQSAVLGPDGQRLRVSSVAAIAGFKSMHDLTVANIHTYYVIAGTAPVLVHNCGGTLTVNKYSPQEPGGLPHFSVKVSDDTGNALHTEQVQILPDGSMTAITPFMPDPSMPLIDSVTIRLPNASAALQKQIQLMDAGDLGQYSILGNSCVTHCMDVARAGGLTIPGMRDFATMLDRTWRWFKE